ncbi:hypothetical protein GCM10027093_62640 [Paraburkholderia jirisanensis]
MGHTSKTVQEATTTTGIKIQSSSDAFSLNEMVTLDRNAFGDRTAIAAAEWTTDRLASHTPFLSVLTFVFEQVEQRLEDYGFWLLTGSTAWQPDTRLTRYRKRFRSLKMRGIDFEVVADRSESVVEMDGKLKFFGAVKLDETILALVEPTMTPHPCAYIVALPDERGQDFPLSSGWSGIWNNDSQLIESIVASDGIVLQRIGFFDDPDVGLLALGSPTVLAKMVS